MLSSARVCAKNHREDESRTNVSKETKTDKTSEKRRLRTCSRCVTDSDTDCLGVGERSSYRLSATKHLLNNSAINPAGRLRHLPLFPLASKYFSRLS